MHKIRSACQPVLIIVRGRTLVLRANAKKVFLTNRPPQWLALSGCPQFSWEEKLVAPLIATPNVDRAIEDKKDGQRKKEKKKKENFYLRKRRFSCCLALLNLIRFIQTGRDFWMK